MVLNCNQMKKLFVKALKVFLEQEADQIMSDVNERNLCGRFAHYLQVVADDAKLAGYHADPEYNRMQDGRVKTILDEEMVVSTINCDVILHSRGTKLPDDNLIAMEMKKSSAPASKKDMDRKRLRALTKESFDGVWSADGMAHPEHVCGYKLGVFVVLDRRSRECQVEYYGRGAQFLAERFKF